MGFILNQDFNSGVEPSGWTHSGAGISYAYATSPAPLEGAFSFRMTSTDVSATFDKGSDSSGEQWGHFMLNVASMPVGGGNFAQIIITYPSSFAANPIIINVFDTGVVQFSDSNGLHNISTASSISAGTTYHVWWRYKPGSGSNSEKELWINTVDNRAGTAGGFHAVDTAGALTVNIEYYIQSANQGPSPINVIFDVVQWANSDEFAGGGGTLPPGQSTGMWDW